MPLKVAVIYNQPVEGRYSAAGETAAVVGVIEAVDAVQRAISELGHDSVTLSLLPPLEDVRRSFSTLRADLVFNLFEGFDGYPGAEADIADMLSEMGFNYTGCRGSTLATALDKCRAKAALQEAGLPTPGYQLLNSETLESFSLGYPCIVKPRAEDASHGISERSVVNDYAQLARQVAGISDAYGGSALVEEYIDGREFNATVLGNRKPEVLPLTEIAFSLPAGLPRILPFSAKWERESVYYRNTVPVCPAGIDPDLQNNLALLAVSAFGLLGCTNYARVDFRVDREGRPFIIEVNPNPDISPGGGLALQARAAGMSYRQLIEKIIHISLGKIP